MEIKAVLSIIAIILTFIAYIPYLRDIVKKKTHPHIYSWLIWGLVASIAFGLQVSGGAGVGAWVMLVVAMLNIAIFIFGFKYGTKDITKTDTVFLLLALFALFLWLIVKQPVLSVILDTSISIIGLGPTVRKSWNRPHSETLFLWELNSFRHVLTIFALQNYSIVTWLYPGAWIVANALFSIMLIIRRRQVEK